MKKSNFVLSVALLLLPLCALHSQSITLDSETHNSLIRTCSGHIYDNSVSGIYAPNQDNWITICTPEEQETTHKIQLTFQQFEISLGDTVMIYMGESISSPAMTRSDGNPFFVGRDLLGRSISPPLSAQTGCLTIRLKTDSEYQSMGFMAEISCMALCQQPTVTLDSVFYVLGDYGLIPHNVHYGTDTIVLEDETTQAVNFKSVDICFGENVVFVAKPSFPDNDIYYHQQSSSCIYEWDFGDGYTECKLWQLGSPLL